jgi:RNA polymerase sigma-70 factor (ECF subfamily)
MRDETSSPAATCPGAGGAVIAGAQAGGGIPDTVLADLWQRGRAAWPELALEAAALARYLDERAPAGDDTAAWLRGLRAADVFLACACVEGTAGAVRAFEAAHLTKMDVYLRSLHPTAELVADTKQELLAKLFVGGEGHPPKVRQYGARGALQGWVRLVALSTALDLLSSDRTTRLRTHDADEIAHGMVPVSNPEVDLMKARYGGEFVAALREATASLSPRDRNLLRFTFVEHLTPARIGAIYGVHRTTAMRWIEAIQEEVLARTRAQLMESLHLSPVECDSLIALVRSGIHLTLSSLLKTAS